MAADQNKARSGAAGDDSALVEQACPEAYLGKQLLDVRGADEPPYRSPIQGEFPPDRRDRLAGIRPRPASTTMWLRKVNMAQSTLRMPTSPAFSLKCTVDVFACQLISGTSLEFVCILHQCAPDPHGPESPHFPRFRRRIPALFMAQPFGRGQPVGCMVSPRTSRTGSSSLESTR